MILQSQKPNLPVVKKTSNHLQNKQGWLGEEVVESEVVGSEEGELEEEEEINLEKQPVSVRLKLQRRLKRKENN